MALFTLPKAGAGSIVVSRLYSLCITHSLMLSFHFKASLRIPSRLIQLVYSPTLQSLDRT